MPTWQCVQQCGACCHLDPTDRPDLASYLTAPQLERYLSLVGEDGWCIHYNAATRQCQIYETRPDFCRVQPDTFEAMFGIGPEALDEFAIACCEQQIESIYGDPSPELTRFHQAVYP
ncbi:YkgJ family cysteine cluster protein [Romeria aff. gracilis LEGE 07310]|uniref:YkgJ family cysteine cluster protein n=1 Tax=Vasconcelosia minhoensis LEGE 07310 TaxID=915328 RepID=A0A8J7DA92_9CYAN|nr:YkgJ family cysteine cluster protein [Romeria gracilis]MBE9076162.1 YkgJ family cysteine cluster protein [Romeria aff. gracilis LEGE 07310]